MNTVRRIVNAIIFLTALALGLPTPDACAEVQSDYHILRIAPREHAAVMRINEGPAKLVRVGDTVGKAGKITEIVEGRVTIEESMGKDSVMVIIRMTDGKQTVERTRKTAPTQPQLYGVVK